MAKIEAKEKTLSKILKGDYVLEVPPYQRPYAWTTEQVSELFEDLNAARQRNDTPYFLGSIVLIRTADGNRHDIIDGQQRLITLSMLLCVARDLADDTEQKEQLDKYIAQRADIIEGTSESMRLLIRQRDQASFEEWVQKPGGTTTAPQNPLPQHTESQRRLIENAKLLREALTVLTPDERIELLRFVVTKCYIIVAVATDRESAYRMFTVLNGRGLNLSATDILKAEIIGTLPESARAEATDDWETYEDRLGREHFRNLFQAICSIYVKDKIHRALETEFQESVLNTLSAEEFVQSVLRPYVDAYTIYLNAEYPGTASSHEIHRVLGNLKSLDDYTVLPPLLAYLRHAPPNNANRTLRFLKRLEALGFGLRLLKTGTEARIRRYSTIVKHIEKASAASRLEEDLDADLLAFDTGEKGDLRDILDGPIGTSTLRKQLLLLLDSALADAGATYDRSNCTIEHVLPQTVTEESPWQELFPDAESREESTQQLGNLVLLSRSKNSKAANWDFSRKRDTYFKSDKVVPFALTVDVLDSEEWTPKSLRERHQRLIKLLGDRWEIN